MKLSLRDLVKAVIKHLLFVCGALGVWHRWRNREHLTVLMLHRVLPRGSPEYANSEQDYVVSLEFLEPLLRFVERYYSPISVDQLRDALNGRGHLPPCPLLVTFDDGWADNLQYAMPAFANRQAKPLVFVATEVLDESAARWWADAVVELKLDPAGTRYRQLEQRLGEQRVGESSSGPATQADATSATRFYSLLAAVARLAAGDRNELLEGLVRYRPAQRQMVSWEQAAELAEQGFALGGHSHQHVPLTYHPMMRSDLATSAQKLRSIRGCPPLLAMSFPHGRYDSAVVQAAVETGFDLLFTSDPILNQVVPRAAATSTPLLGRVGIADASMTDGRGRFLESALAASLFFRARGRLSAEPAEEGPGRPFGR